MAGAVFLGAQTGPARRYRVGRLERSRADRHIQVGGLPRLEAGNGAPRRLSGTGR